MAASAVNPIWLVKTRLQLHQGKIGIWQMVKRVYQREGVRGFYKVFFSIKIFLNFRLKFYVLKMDEQFGLQVFSLRILEREFFRSRSRSIIFFGIVSLDLYQVVRQCISSCKIFR